MGVKLHPLELGIFYMHPLNVIGAGIFAPFSHNLDMYSSAFSSGENTLFNH